LNHDRGAQDLKVKVQLVLTTEGQWSDVRYKQDPSSIAEKNPENNRQNCTLSCIFMQVTMLE